MAKHVVKARAARTVASPAIAVKGHNKPPKDTATAAQIAVAGELGWRSAGNDIAVSQLWKQIEKVGNVKAVRDEFNRRYLARRAFPNAVRPSVAMLKEGERIRKVKVADRDPQTEYKWHEAMRQAWSRLAKKAKVRPVGGLAGNSNAAKKPGKVPAPVTVKQVLKAKLPSLPVAQNASDVNAFVEFEAKRIMRFVNENAGTVEGAIKSAVADFARTIATILAKKPDSKAA